MKSYEQALQECKDYEADYYDHLEMLLSKDKISEDVFHQVRDTMVREMEIKENGMDKKDTSFGFVKPKEEFVFETSEDGDMVQIDIRKLPKRHFINKRLNLEKGLIYAAVGTGSSGKTMFLQYLMSCVASGQPLFGEWPVEQGPVIHIDMERTETITHRRYQRIWQQMGIKENLPIRRVKFEKQFDSDPKHLKEVENILVEKYLKGRSLAIIDSLLRVTVGDENLSKDMIVPLRMLERAAARSGCTILLICHMGKNAGHGAKQKNRGTSAIYDAVYGEMDMEKVDRGPCEVSFSKANEGTLPLGFTFEIKDTGEYIEDQECTEGLDFELLIKKIEKKVDVKLMILDTISKSLDVLNQSALFKIIKGDRGTFNRALEILEKEQYITLTKGRSIEYSITDKGREFLEKEEGKELSFEAVEMK